jgi:hypothetical protein
MNALRCDWAWMAEAADDGRLTDDQQASFARHVGHCAACERNARDLAGLRRVMSAVLAPPLSDVQHHRQRQVLLARAGGAQVSLAKPILTWGRGLAFAALSVAVLGVGAWRLAIGRNVALAEAPRYEVTSLTGASWTNEEAAGTARVTLSRGSAEFHVHKLGAGQKFFVTLPDGEIEVRGTRFVVDIVEARTRYVVVMEGKVALRLPGNKERLLLAGQRWDEPPQPSLAIAPRQASRPDDTSPVVSATANSSAANPIATRVPARKPAPHHPEHTVAAVSPARPASPAIVAHAPPVAAPGPEAPPNLFTRGVDAFRAGRYTEAEKFWASFLAEHPQDSRGEDIAFLRAVARARQGDVQGAAALARAYLERFPRGMRRKEAESLTRHAGP